MSSPGLEPLPFVPGAQTPSIIHFTLADGFQELFGAVEPRKMLPVVQKIGRLVLRMFCRALAGGFRAHAFLKSICTDWGWAGAGGLGVVMRW